MRLQLKVQTRSSQEKIVKQDALWKVYIRQAPTDGKANEAVKRLLAKHFDVRASDVHIVRGITSPLKLIEIKSI